MQQPVSGGDGDRKHPVDIIVNTRTVATEEKSLDYAQVVEIAFPGAPAGKRYNVTYRKGEDAHKEGTLTPGGPAVKLKEGMIFDVTPTTES